MRFHHVVVAALAVCGPLASLPSTEAFTNGAMLLPSYLCGPAIPNPALTGAMAGTIQGADGRPRALGAVLNNLIEYTELNGEFAYDPVTDPTLSIAAMHNANAAKKSKQFHGQAGDRLPAVPALNVIAAEDGPPLDYNKVNIPVIPQVNILEVARIAAIPADQPAIPGYQVAPTILSPQITANQKVVLSLLAKNNKPFPPYENMPNGPKNVFDPADAGEAVLDGAIVYVQDAQNQRVGIFLNGGPNIAGKGPNAEIWPACGGPAGDNRGGIVHNKLLSETNVYNGIEFFLPWRYAFNNWFANMGKPTVTTITFMGAAVTDNGFGYHQTKFTVNPATFPVNIAALNQADVKQCVNTNVKNDLACLASCLDCIKQAGSVAANPAQKIKGVSVMGKATVTCTPDMAAGNPFKGQQTIWTAQCKINNVVTPVVAAGTLFVDAPKAQDANGNVIPLSAEDQAFVDQMNQSLMEIAQNNGTDTQPQNNNPATPYCKTVNTATTTTTTTTTALFTTLTAAFTAFFAARQ